MLRSWKVASVCFVLAMQLSLKANGQENAPTFDIEAEYSFRATDILPAETIKGPNYEIEPSVKVEDGKFVFRVRTRWGILAAKGLPLLELRLREMYAIERAEQLSDQPQLINGFLGTLIQTGSGAKAVLTEPVGTVLRIPAGIRTTLTSVLHPGNKRAGSDVRRKIASQIECDPETNNPILKKLLDWMALRKGLGEFAGKVGLNLTLPGLALIPTTSQFRVIVAEKLPSDINKQIEASLLAMGMPKDVTKSFCRDHAFSTTQRLIILTALQSLQDDVVQLDLLLRRAIATRNESEGMTFIRELALLQALHKQRPVAAIVGGIRSPMLVVNPAANGHVLITSDDYLMLTERLASFRQTYRKNFAETPAELFGDARVTDRARDFLRNASIAVPKSRGRNESE